MSVSTLQNTTWVIGRTPTLGTPTEYNVNLTSKDNSFLSKNFYSFKISATGISFRTSEYSLVDYTGAYDTTEGWNYLYRYITFTGGSDIANAGLIAWLETNAKQISTKETWRIVENATLTTLAQQTVQFSSGGTNFQGLEVRNRTSDTILSFYPLVSTEGIEYKRDAAIHYYNIVQSVDTEVSYSEWMFKDLSFNTAQLGTMLVWLRTNAIKTSSANTLENTKWNFYDIIRSDIIVAGKSYSINFKCGNTSYTSLSFVSGSGSTKYIKFDDTTVFEAKFEGGSYAPEWADEKYKNIVISGGTDASNEELISWLYNAANNATFVVYEHVYRDGNKVQVDSALRDGNGLLISKYYAKKTELVEEINKCTKLYKHTILFASGSTTVAELYIVSSSNTSATTLNDIVTQLNNLGIYSAKISGTTNSYFSFTTSTGVLYLYRAGGANPSSPSFIAESISTNGMTITDTITQL